MNFVIPLRSLCGLLILLGLGPFAGEKAAAAPLERGQARLLELEGAVESFRHGAAVWDPAYTNQVFSLGDKIRTGPRSRAVIGRTDSASRSFWA